MEIAIIAGEVSGDIQGARLVQAIKEISPDVRIWGIGGIRMKNSGVDLIYDITQLAVVGFWEVIRNFHRIRNVFFGILDEIISKRPKAVILIDYPGFNLRLAKKLKEAGITVIYYISPQVWAWGKGRIKEIKENVAKMIVIFPFEEEFFDKAGIPVFFTGHPIIDVIENRRNQRDNLRQELGIKDGEKLIGIFPGSRRHEIKRHLPVFLGAVSNIQNAKFVIAAASQELSELIKSYTNSVPVFLDRAYDIMEASDLVLTSSGTATLETACFGTPMVVIYKMNWITYFFIRSMIKVPDIAMANVVAGRRIVPELVQAEANSENVLKEVNAILYSVSRQKEIRSELEKVKLKLGQPGAAKRAAEAVLSIVHAG